VTANHNASRHVFQKAKINTRSPTIFSAEESSDHPKSECHIF